MAPDIPDIEQNKRYQLQIAELLPNFNHREHREHGALSSTFLCGLRVLCGSNTILIAIPPIANRLQIALRLNGEKADELFRSDKPGQVQLVGFTRATQGEKRGQFHILRRSDTPLRLIKWLTFLFFQITAFALRGNNKLAHRIS